MAKMFYTQEEAAKQLGMSVDDLKQMVRDGRLREFMDNGPVYRVEDINKMSGASPVSGETDVVDLELVDDSDEQASKEDTVITSAGISVFDDEDLEIEADPMAQTQITPSVEDQISLEGTGSGSGLLDLTREADDTSLGAELLEEIYPTGPSVESADVVSVPEPESAVGAPPMMGGGAGQVIEAADPSAAAFTGMAVVGVLAALFLGLVITAVSQDVWPDFLKSLAEGNNPYLLGGGLVAVMAVFGVIGLLVGRSTSGPRM